MNNLLIINAGGYGRTVLGLARGDSACGKQWQIKGFLDSRPELGGTAAPVVGDPMTYDIIEGDIFLCALGSPAQRRKYAAPLLAKGADFISLRPDVNFGERVTFGRGCIFELRATVGADSVLGDFVTILSTTIIGHDVTVGSYVQIGSFVFVGGGACIGNDVVIHPHATILPGVRIGDGAVIGSGSVVIRNVAAGVTMFGNPAKPLSFK